MQNQRNAGKVMLPERKLQLVFGHHKMVWPRTWRGDLCIGVPGTSDMWPPTPSSLSILYTTRGDTGKRQGHASPRGLQHNKRKLVLPWLSHRTAGAAHVLH